MIFFITTPPRKHKLSFCTSLPQIMQDLSGFTTVQEAAEELGFNVISLRVLLRQEKIKGTKIGKIWFVSKDSLREYKSKTAGLSKNDPRRGKKN